MVVETRQDHGWAWMVLLGSSLINALFTGFLKISTLVYSEMLIRFGETALKTSLTMTISQGFSFCFAPVFSYLSNLFGHRIVVIFGGLMAGLGIITCAFAPSIHYIYITFGVIFGLGGGAAISQGKAILVMYFKKRRGLAVALSSVSPGISASLLTPLLTLLFKTYSFFGTMIIVGGLFFNMCVAGALFRPLKLPQLEPEEDKPAVNIERQFKENISDEEEKESQFMGKINQGKCATENLDDGSLALIKEEIKNDKYKSLNVSEPVSDLYSKSVKETAEINDRIPLQNTEYSDTSACDGESEIKNRNTFNTPVQKSISLRNSDYSLNSQHENDTALEGLKKQEKPGIISMCEPSLLKSMTFMLLCITVCVLFFEINITGLFLSGFASEKGFSLQEQEVLLIVLNIVETVVIVGAGIVFDCPVVRRNSPTVYAGVGMGTALCLIIIVFVRTTVAVYVFWILLYSGFGVLHSQSINVLGHVVVVEKQTSAVGIMRFISGFGIIAGTAFGGYLKDKTGKYWWCYLVAGIAGIFPSTAFLIQQQVYQQISCTNSV